MKSFKCKMNETEIKRLNYVLNDWIMKINFSLEVGSSSVSVPKKKVSSCR